LRQVDVEVAVVVVVEEGGARADDLGVVQLAGHPAEMRERQARLFGAVDEPVAVRWEVG
jgi:hypothetical protein